MDYALLPRAAVSLLRKAKRIAQLRIALGAEGGWEALEDELGTGCLVLMYHHIGPFRPGTYPELTVSSKRFEGQIRWLARNGYVGIRPAQWLRWLRDGVALPKKPIMIRFDDAYADIAECALPVLLRYGFGGCVFVVTRLLGGTNAWDETKGSGTLRLLSADQIRYWSGNGIEFGAHSRTHADLTKLNPGQLTDEVIGSKRDLEDLLGSPVTSFAYPYGRHNAAALEMVRANFGLGFGTMEGINFVHSDRHLLRRIYVGPHDTLLEFALSIRWGGREGARGTRLRGAAAAEN
jgi:peptidoglycan/xylan/chitin deacetylase (PgdA/CDA1 family)